MNLTTQRSAKYFLPVLIAVWCLVQGAMLYYNGIYVEGEALRIIREANYLHEGQPFSSPIYFTYLTEILLTHLSMHAGGYALNIIVHLIFNLTACFMFFNFLKNRLSPSLAFLGTLLLIFCIPYQLYNTFLYTESIFFSLSIVYACLLLSNNKRSGGRLAITLLVLILLCLTRPSGFFFVLATIAFGFYRARSVNFLVRLLLFIIPLTITIIIINYGMQTGGGIDIVEPFLREHIICDQPLQQNKLDINLNENPNSISGLWYYITHNFGHFSKLALNKTIAFFGLIRPWYSTTHNVLLCLFFYPLMFGILYRIIRRRFSDMLLFTLMLTIIFWLFVILSCDEWHNRFFLTLTPFLIGCMMEIFKPGKQNHQQING